MSEPDYFLPVIDLKSAENNLKNDEIIKTLKYYRCGTNDRLIYVNICVNDITYERIFRYNCDTIEKTLREIQNE